MTLNRGEIVGKVTIEKKNTSIVYIDSTTLDNDRLDSLFYHNEYIENIQKLIKSGLPIEKLDNTIETINAPIGWQGIPSDSYMNSGEGVPLLRIKNINELLLDEESLIGVQEEIYNAQPAIQAQANDIIITRVGTIGRVCRIPERISKIAMGQNLTRIKLKETMLESGFMLAYMSSKFCQLQMQRYAYGGVQASLTNKNIKNLLVPIPSPEIQKYIGDKVRKAEELREKAKKLKEQGNSLIEEILNINKHLDEINNDKGKYRWLKTDVLNDRIDSEYYKEKYLEIINHLKGSSFQYIPLRKMVLDMYTGKKTSEMVNGKKVFFIQSGNISGNFLEVGEQISVKVENYKVIEVGDLLIAKDGNTIGKMAVNFSGELAIINEHTYCIRFNEEYKKYSAYVYYLLVNDNINELLKREATGSAQKGLNQQFIDNMIIPLINEESVEKLYEIEEKRCNNIYLSKQLIQEAKKDVEDLIEGNFDMSKRSF